jgi:hypothetical protein
MKCLDKLSLLFVLLLCSAVVLPVSANDQLTQMSSTISDKLQNLKQELLTIQSDLISTQVSLQQANSDLALSQQEREQQVAASMKLYDSLTTINEKLNDAYKSIDRYKVEIQQLHKIMWIAFGTALLIIALKVAGFILYAKHIPVPRWLDILI